MQVKYLRDKKGNALAVFKATPDALVSVEAEPSKGERLEAADLPDDYANDPKASFKQLARYAK